MKSSTQNMKPSVIYYWTNPLNFGVERRGLLGNPIALHVRRIVSHLFFSPYLCIGCSVNAYTVSVHWATRPTTNEFRPTRAALASSTPISQAAASSPWQAIYDQATPASSPPCDLVFWVTSGTFGSTEQSCLASPSKEMIRMSRLVSLLRDFRASEFFRCWSRRSNWLSSLGKTSLAWLSKAKQSWSHISWITWVSSCANPNLKICFTYRGWTTR